MVRCPTFVAFAPFILLFYPFTGFGIYIFHILSRILCCPLAYLTFEYQRLSRRQDQKAISSGACSVKVARWQTAYGLAAIPTLTVCATSQFCGSRHFFPLFCSILIFIFQSIFTQIRAFFLDLS